MRNFIHRCRSLLAAVLLAAVAPAGAESIERPFAIALRPAEGEPVRGKATAYDETGLTLEGADGSATVVAWADLKPRDVLALHRKLLDRDDAADWLRLGSMLHGRDDGKEEAELALRRAVEADASLADAADKVRAGEAVDPDHLTGGTTPPGGETETPGGGLTPGGGPASGGGPVTEGPVQSRYWGTLSPEVMEASTQELIAFAEETRRTMNLPSLRGYADSEVFLFFSDLDPAEAKRWSALLDRMYDKLCETFGVGQGTNVFRGKALVFVFQSRDDYRRFQTLMHRTDPGTSAGMCHGFGNGYVHIAFYRQPNDEDFAGILVHESAHGFLHRYRDSPHIVSWLNEGLAEYVAGLMVPGHQNPDDVLERSKRLLQERGDSLGGLFGDGKIEWWQYPVSQTLINFMIAQDRERFRALVDAIKAGKPWRDALEQDYGTTVERLTAGFGRAIGIPDLRP